MKNKLLEKIHSKEARIGIIGLGYVGLPLALRFVAAGFRVIGFDIDAAKTEMLNSGASYFAHIARIKWQPCLRPADSRRLPIFRGPMGLMP